MRYDKSCRQPNGGGKEKKEKRRIRGISTHRHFLKTKLTRNSGLKPASPLPPSPRANSNYPDNGSGTERWWFRREIGGSEKLHPLCYPRFTYTIARSSVIRNTCGFITFYVGLSAHIQRDVFKQQHRYTRNGADKIPPARSRASRADKRCRRASYRESGQEGGQRGARRRNRGRGRGVSNELSELIKRTYPARVLRRRATAQTHAGTEIRCN